MGANTKVAPLTTRPRCPLDRGEITSAEPRDATEDPSMKQAPTSAPGAMWVFSLPCSVTSVLAVLALMPATSSCASPNRSPMPPDGAAMLTLPVLHYEIVGPSSVPAGADEQSPGDVQLAAGPVRITKARRGVDGLGFPGLVCSLDREDALRLNADLASNVGETIQWTLGGRLVQSMVISGPFPSVDHPSVMFREPGDWVSLELAEVLRE